MKFPILFGLVLMISLQISQAQTPANCSQILALNPSAPSGVYNIDPDGSGILPAMDCYCDMTTDGGGWTLILNYNHLAGSSPILKIRTDSLPLQGNVLTGFDESNSIYWGHSDTALTRAIPFDEVRFYGISDAHNRVIHFKSNHAGTISYFKTGLGSTLGISSNFTPLTNHTANLPASINMSVNNMGNNAMTDYPLWTGSLYHWFCAGVDGFCSSPRWEVDDYPCVTEPSTLHQIWVKETNPSVGMQKNTSGDAKLVLWPNPASEVVHVSLPLLKDSQTTLNLYNSLGQKVFSETPQTALWTIDVSSFAPGIYTLVLSGGQENYYQKLLIKSETK